MTLEHDQFSPDQSVIVYYLVLYFYFFFFLVFNFIGAQLIFWLCIFSLNFIQFVQIYLCLPISWFPFTFHYPYSKVFSFFFKCILYRHSLSKDLLIETVFLYLKRIKNVFILKKLFCSVHNSKLTLISLCTIFWLLDPC